MFKLKAKKGKEVDKSLKIQSASFAFPTFMLTKNVGVAAKKKFEHITGSHGSV